MYLIIAGISHSVRMKLSVVLIGKLSSTQSILHGHILSPAFELDMTDRWGGGVGKTGQVRYELESEQYAEDTPAESTIYGWKSPV